MRTLALALTILFPILGFAMPSASDISNVESLVNELLPAGAKPAERAASAVKLSGQAETEAAKYLLLRTAFLSYVKAGEYEKAEEAFDALLEAVPDFPLGDQENLFSKAMFSVPSKGAPNLRARQAAIKGQVKQLSVVKRIRASIDKNPANKALYARLGESYVILNDWPKALAAFSKASDPVLAATATHELELKPGAGTASSSLMKFADYWWDYSSKSSELIAAMRSHAVALYKLSLPTLTGLNKVRVEKRIKEAENENALKMSDSVGSSRGDNVPPAGIAKFIGVELVGNTVKLEKGVLSNFGGGSYGKIRPPFEPKGAAIEAVVDFTTGPVVGTSGILGGIGGKNGFTPFYTSANQLVGYVSFSGSAWDLLSNAPVGLELKPSTNYRIKCTWDKKSYAWFVWSKSWKPLKKFESNKPVFDGLELQFGTNRGNNAPFNGTIDLNRSYIKLDGKLWWEGVKGAYKNANR